VKPGLALGLAGAAVAAALAAWTIPRIRFWRRKSPDEIERLRRLDIYRRGRIASGHIVDILESEVGGAVRITVVYSYEVAGVSYEVGQDVTALTDLASQAHGLAGQTVSVKYDPKTPTNSIIACEGWSGVSVVNGARDSRAT
jgi:hypothetical protein